MTLTEFILLLNSRDKCIILLVILFLLLYVVNLLTCTLKKIITLSMTKVMCQVWHTFFAVLAVHSSSFSVLCLYSVSCTWAHQKFVRITQNILQHPDMTHFLRAVRTRRLCRKSEDDPCLLRLPQASTLLDAVFKRLMWCAPPEVCIVSSKAARDKTSVITWASYTSRRLTSKLPAKNL